jgi:hypothetical protein
MIVRLRVQCAQQFAYVRLRTLGQLPRLIRLIPAASLRLMAVWIRRTPPKLAIHFSGHRRLPILKAQYNRFSSPIVTEESVYS